MKSTVVSSVPEWGSCREASAAESEGKKSLLWTDSSGGPESCSVRSPPSIWERLLRVTHFSTSTDGARYHQKRQIMWPQKQLQQCLSTQMSPKQDSTEGKGLKEECTEWYKAQTNDAGRVGLCWNDLLKTFKINLEHLEIQMIIYKIQRRPFGTVGWAFLIRFNGSWNSLNRNKLLFL